MLAEAGGCLGRVETRWKLLGCGDGGARALVAAAMVCLREEAVGGALLTGKAVTYLQLVVGVAYLPGTF